MHAGFGGKRLRRPNPVSRNFQALRIRLHRHIRTRIFPDRHAFVVFDLNRYRTDGVFRQEIIKHRPVGRILASRFVRRQRRIGIDVAADAQSCLRFEKQISVLVVVELAQRSDVVEDPESASVRRYDEIVILNDEIAHRGRRQIQPQRLPVCAVIERDIHALFRSREKQPFALGIFADGVHRLAGRDFVHNFCPRFAAVLRSKNVRLQIVES